MSSRTRKVRLLLNTKKRILISVQAIAAEATPRTLTSNGQPAVVPATVLDAGSRYADLSAQDYKVQGLITEAQHAQKVKLTLTRTLIVTLNLTRTLTFTIPEPDPDR